MHRCKIDVSKIVDWKTARKTQSIIAKHMLGVFNNAKDATHFLLHTVEGSEPINIDCVLCVGPAAEAWQMSVDRLESAYKYNGISYPSDWHGYSPLPGSFVYTAEVTYDLTDLHNSFYIIGKYGERYPATGEDNCQHGSVGDMICRSSTDVWIVNRKIFDATYTFGGV